MIAQFSLRLICGMSLMWVLMPRNQVTAGFFRIQMLVVLGLGILAALTVEIGGSPDANLADNALLSQSAAAVLCGTIAAAAFLGSVFWTLERRRAGTAMVFLIAALSACLLPAVTVDEAGFSSARGVLRVLSEWSSAAMLGAAVTGMLLGHWYLTAPTMSIAPLSRLNVYFAAAALVRLLLSAAGLWLLREHSIGSTQGLWLSMRWLAGILGPICVVIMVWRILKYRNTQAATGVLFVGVILTFIGEMSASLLYHDLRLPL